MKERPILMRGNMVRATLNTKPGLIKPIDPHKPFKWQTRRVVKPQPNTGPESGLEPNDVIFSPTPGENGLCKLKASNGWGARTRGWLNAYPYKPYGKPGDRLWVRETWQVMRKHNALWLPGTHTTTHGKPMKIEPDYEYYITYKADGSVASIDQSFYWRPSIFMPRWASRINREITNIRVEHVQDISSGDSIAEGIPDYPDFKGDSPEDDFMILWDSINATPKPRYARIDGKRIITHYESYPWEDITETREYRGRPWHIYGNPYVWVVEFKRV